MNNFTELTFTPVTIVINLTHIFRLSSVPIYFDEHFFFSFIMLECFEKLIAGIPDKKQGRAAERAPAARFFDRYTETEGKGC